MEIELLPIEKLIPYARNSRTHSDEQVAQVAASIMEFGFTNPVLIGKDNDIIAGHGRVLAARKLALKEVPCIRLGHLTENQKRAYVIADNKLALNSGWDDELLKVELLTLKDENFNIDLLGFNTEELDALLLTEQIEGKTDPDDVPEAPKDPVTVLGDIWTLGNHRLMCGDSTSIDAVQRLMNGQLAGLLHTDPPY
jgi:ParB-like chromosome segregation protein Spo0J